ncbi:MAG: cell division protein FtsQ/DivIB [Rhizobiaceae bacterium]|nr:cell division protein FtsQ/DivIB [Rhizobiaceae bacterium]
MDGGGRELLSIGLFARHGDTKDDAQAVNATGEAGSGRRVLPRFLRKPARLFNRFLAGNVMITRRGWIVMAVGAVLIASGGVFANSKQGNTIVAEVSANLGFTINNVVVEGLKELPQDDVLARLTLGKNKSLFTFDVNKAREDIGQLAWVRDVVVAKSYPDRLIIRIDERKPFAIWQNTNELSLVERDGELIDRFDQRFSALPLLVGEGANIAGAEIIFQLSRIPVLKKQVKAYMRIAERRWDLRLKNGITVRLPDGNIPEALLELARLDKVYGLLTRDIEVVDLRLKDRFVVSLSEEAVQRRSAISGKPQGDHKEKKI